jgi:hypothetical protein
MKRGRFAQEQIDAVLREDKAGAKTADLARKHGISEPTLLNCKAKFGGGEVSEAKGRDDNASCVNDPTSREWAAVCSSQAMMRPACTTQDRDP